MKKTILLAFPFVVLIGAVLTVARLEAQRAPDWKTELDKYIASSLLPQETIEIQATVKARTPEHFNAIMGTPVRQDWPWGIEEIPYPPTTLWCLLLARENPSAAGVQAEPVQQVTYIGRHTDKLWRVGWLVHEGPQAPFTPQLTADLAAIGCDLDFLTTGQSPKLMDVDETTQ